MKFIVLVFSIFLALNTSAAKKPNVILFFIDDMGWSDFSCFGNKDIETTHIDAMAKEGICFEQFYVNSPICSPSRVAISTGQYPQRWGITSYLAHRKSNRKRGMAQWLDPKAPVIAKSLKKAGYATGHFGKWHMGGQRDVNDAPMITDYGFDESLTNFEGLGKKLLPLVMKPGQKEFKKIWGSAAKLKGETIWMDRSKITGGFCDAAIKFIKKAEADDKPFYVNLWPDDVHSPFWPPLDKWGSGSKRDIYLGVLKAMDDQFAILFDYVKKSETLKNNTLILICSDNGFEPGAGKAGPLKGYKTNLYEGGIRSSLVVWGPGLMKKDKMGTRNKKSVFSAIDIVPSLLTICGASPEANYDGEDLSAIILGNSDSSRQKPISYRRPPDRKSFYDFKNLPDLAIRKGKWKLLCDFDGGRPELYDISADKGEKNNLAKSNPELVKKLTKEILDWNKTMPTDAGNEPRK